MLAVGKMRLLPLTADRRPLTTGGKYEKLEAMGANLVYSIYVSNCEYSFTSLSTHEVNGCLTITEYSLANKLARISRTSRSPNNP